MKPSHKYEVIYCRKGKYLVSIMCRFFGVSRSGYYDFAKRRGIPQRDAALAEMVSECQQRCGKTYGCRRVRLWLKREKALLCNPKTVLRVMNKYGLLSEMRRRRTYKYMGQQVHKYENLLNRNFKPRKKMRPDKQPQRVNLLVDVQAKLQAGKGPGYERWAKVFNLKQMAQTLNFLTGNNLLEYAELEEKAAVATARFNTLSAQIKAAETRMAEIGNLKAHIVNYSKTREIYTAYRKAGYSKKFYEAHEGDILLHKAAKAAFDALPGKKVPTIKALQSEYETLLSEKKKAYSGYAAARKEMKALLTAKANIDRLLGDVHDRTKNGREQNR